MPNFHPLETVLRNVPLGMRCVDITTGGPVTGGLWVAATPNGGPARTVQASSTQSGFYVLQGLPGLHDFEFGLDSWPPGSPPVGSPPGGKEFVVHVEDTEGRYLPWGTLLTLPREQVFTSYLFSAPSRVTVPGFAVVRGGLRDTTRTLADGSFAPAGFARIEAQYDLTSPPTIYVGLADERGQFALFLPFPNPLQPPAGITVASPNSPGRKTLADLKWPLTLRFFYQPTAQSFIRHLPQGGSEIIVGQQPGVTDVGAASGGRRTVVPDIASLLVQPAAEVFAASGDPSTAELLTVIEFGKDLVARTEGDSDVRLAPLSSSPP